MKKLQKLDPIDMGYFFFLGIFSLVAFIELIKYLVSEYTFARACIVFTAVTFLYLARKHIWGTGKISGAQKTTRKEGILPLTSSGRRRKMVKSKVSSWLSADSFFLAFIMYGLFVVAYSLGDFFDANTFFYVSLALIVYYGVVRISGTKIDTSLPETPFSEATFLKLLILSTSLYMIVLVSLFREGEVLQGDIIFYLVNIFLYITGFTYLFSRVFHRVYACLTSRHFRVWVVSHTYFLLSGTIFLISFVLIAGKMGMFDGLLIQKINPTVYTPTLIETGQDTQEPDYQEVLEIRPLVELYDIQAPLTLGDSGEEVSKLQQALTLIGNYTQDITGQYDEYTRTTLRDVLIEKCAWPETTQGIVGPQAKACLDSIEVERSIRIDVSGLEGDSISNEVIPQ